MYILMFDDEENDYKFETGELARKVLCWIDDDEKIYESEDLELVTKKRDYLLSYYPETKYKIYQEIK